jgi:hypothetical protein
VALAQLRPQRVSLDATATAGTGLYQPVVREGIAGYQEDKIIIIFIIINISSLNLISVILRNNVAMSG